MLNAASLSLLIASVALAQAANKSSSDEIASPNGTLVEFPAAPASVASTPLAAPAPSLTTDDLIRWKYESRVASPSADDSTATPRWRAIALPAQVLSGARQDLADLRLIDAQDREVPFVVRTLRTISESQALNAELFNQGVVEGKQTEVRLDLGEAPTTHSQVEISTAGREFRRAVTVEGSDDGQTWTKLADGRLARFASDSSNGAGFEQHDVSYAPSRFRYLRVRVARDPQTDDDPPEVQSAVVRHRVEVKGQDVEWPVTLEPRFPTRTQNIPSSTWTIVFPEPQLPVDYLLLDIPAAQFSRDFLLEVANDSGIGNEFEYEYRGGGQVAAGTLQRVESSASNPATRTPLRIDATQTHATRLKLHLFDHGNAPIMIDRVRAFAAVRELIFEHDPQQTGDLRLVYGNPQATAPHYDLERTLPVSLVPEPQQLELQARQENPRYLPPPIPMSERVPWLIYVVLGSISAVVAIILADVARRAIQLHDAQPAN